MINGTSHQPRASLKQPSHKELINTTGGKLFKNVDTFLLEKFLQLINK
jgi:hypothetical protein